MNAKNEPEEPPKEWKKKVYKGERSIAKNNEDRYVIPNPDRGGWDVIKENRERSSGHFDTQAEAIKRAKDIVEKSGQGNGEVRIQDKNSRFRDSASGSKNESPKKDTKH